MHTGDFTTAARTFISIPLFNDTQDDNEQFVTPGFGFTIVDNRLFFKNEHVAAGSQAWVSSTPLKIMHWGYNPYDKSYLFSPAQGAVLSGGSPSAVATLLAATWEIEPTHFTRQNNCVHNGAYDFMLDRRRETPHIYEMGLPVQPTNLPWHVDIGQRVPLADGRDRLDEIYRLTLLATIFESLVAAELPKRPLRDNWVIEVLSRCQLSEEALAARLRPEC